jgi:hypothetical protein
MFFSSQPSKLFLAAEFISSSSKHNLLLSGERKIRPSGRIKVSREKRLNAVLIAF